ncbi:cysteine-rich KTR domain-containing protein [Hominenteromicrobium sp.]|uniref:cysteine-rich KTR domain-containing protein n=1 Tax=Hominenteromicrobium sp. TaxID=3073581 RepID=UPI003AF1D86E
MCNGKERVQVFHNTVLKDFPLFCPKCKLTHIFDVEKLGIVADRPFSYIYILSYKSVSPHDYCVF